MESELITIRKDEYDALLKKAEIADDACVQLKLSFEDMRHGRIHRF